MLGAHAFDLIGRTVHSVVHEERKGREKCSDQCRTGRAFLVREGTSGQDVFYRRNGASFPVEFSVTPMVEHTWPWAACSASATSPSATPGPHER